jgi:broad specificity phosphatase PhoE
MKTTFIAVRHGQSVANFSKVFAGSREYALTALGEAQARETAKYIKEHFSPDIVVTSPIGRAKKTGEIIAQAVGAEVCTENGIKEIDAGLWEGVPWKDLITLFPEDRKVWIEDIGKCRCTGGESVAEVYERVVLALKALEKKYSGKTVVVACHYTPVRSMWCWAKGFKAEDMAACSSVPENASVTVISVENGVPEALEYNICQHLLDAGLIEKRI